MVQEEEKVKPMINNVTAYLRIVRNYWTRYIYARATEVRDEHGLEAAYDLIGEWHRRSSILEDDTIRRIKEQLD